MALAFSSTLGQPFGVPVAQAAGKNAAASGEPVVIGMSAPFLVRMHRQVRHSSGAQNWLSKKSMKQVASWAAGHSSLL